MRSRDLRYLLEDDEPQKSRVAPVIVVLSLLALAAFGWFELRPLLQSEGTKSSTTTTTAPSETGSRPSTETAPPAKTAPPVEPSPDFVPDCAPVAGCGRHCDSKQSRCSEARSQSSPATTYDRRDAKERASQGRACA